MELRSCVLAEVEPGDSDPGVPGPSSLVTEGSGELVPISVMSRRAPIASSPQMLGSIGTAFNPDVLANVETGYGPALEAGSEVQPTQPPNATSCRYSLRLSGSFWNDYG